MVLLIVDWARYNMHYMMTSSNGNIFRVTGHLCGKFSGHRWISHKRPVTRSFDVFFYLRLSKRLSKQSWGWWFETPSHPLWRHCNYYNNRGRTLVRDWTHKGTPTSKRVSVMPVWIKIAARYRDRAAHMPGKHILQCMPWGILSMSWQHFCVNYISRK